MHRCQYNKTWSNQDKFLAGNLNLHNVKTMLPSHNNIYFFATIFLASTFQTEKSKVQLLLDIRQLSDTAKTSRCFGYLPSFHIVTLICKY